VLKLRAERKAGEMLGDNPAIGRGKSDTLSLLGIARHQSSRWQKVASLPCPSALAHRSTIHPPTSPASVSSTSRTKQLGPCVPHSRTLTTTASARPVGNRPGSSGTAGNPDTLSILMREPIGRRS